MAEPIDKIRELLDELESRGFFRDRDAYANSDALPAVETSSPVFTPGNEPYLGRELLFRFDSLICSCLELNSKCAPASHSGSLSQFQHALCVLVPQTITLALSIRELIRQGYLFGAKVLVRPLTERAVTILYLWKNESALEIWDDGWKHNKRPSLQKMIEHLSQGILPGESATSNGFTHHLNSATHGDPLSAQWNVILREDGAPVFPVSKNLSSPQLADEICAEVIPWVATTMGIMSTAFGQESLTPGKPSGGRTRRAHQSRS